MFTIVDGILKFEGWVVADISTAKMPATLRGRMHSELEAHTPFEEVLILRGELEALRWEIDDAKKRFGA